MVAEFVEQVLLDRERARDLRKPPVRVEAMGAALRGRPHAPAGPDWDAAVAYWKTLRSDPDAKFDREVTLDTREIRPQVTDPVTITEKLSK